MKRFVSTVLFAIFALTLVPQVVHAQRGDVYNSRHAQQAHEVYFGTIVDVRSVKIQGNAGVGGTVAGGALGRAAGRSIGGGSGKRAAKTAGTILGATAGRRVQQNARSAQGVELTVRLEDGKSYSIVQERDNAYRVGDRVRVLRAPDGTMRVRL